MTDKIKILIQKTNLFEHVPITPDIFSSPLYAVSISEEDEHITVHIGPLDPYQGGSGVSITLNSDFSYKSHIYETLDQAPDFGDVCD